MRRMMAVCAGLVMAAAVVRAQDVPPRTEAGVGMSQNLYGMGSVAGSLTSVVANKPYQAEKMTRSVQTLGDGTIITVETHGMMARSSSGQAREDVHSNTSMIVNGRALDKNMTMTTVTDPAASTLTMWQTGGTASTLKTAIVMQMPNIAGLRANANLRAGGVVGALGSAPPPGTVSLGNSANAAAPLRVNAPAAPKLLGNLTNQGVEPLYESGAPARTVAATVKMATESNPDKVTHEDLGQQSIEGLLVTGKRTTTVIPMGKIGNDRPITVTDEVWTTPELGIIVKQIDNDPRTGERTMELTGVTKAEPDKALFQVPPGYKVQDMAEMMKKLGQMGKTPGVGATPETK